MGLISDVAVGTTIDPTTWGNIVRDHLVQRSTSGAPPSDTTEGATYVQTDKKRLIIVDGASEIRVAAYAAAGRTGCTIKRTATQSVHDGSTTVDVSFDGEDYDSDNLFTATDTKATIPTDLGGLWACKWQVWWAADPGANMSCRASISTGGTKEVADGSAASGVRNKFGTAFWLSGGSFLMPLDAADDVGVNVWQNSGGSINITARLHLYMVGV